jgi:hypothetical protein
MREDESHGHRRRQPQLIDDRHEVVTIRAETVQPDHRRVSGRGGFENDVLF